MAADPFYAQCCVTGVPAAEQKVEWHHAMIYAGKQVQERWCIIPLLDTVHANEKKRGVRQVIDWIIFNRATDEELRKYSKTINYIKRREWLNKHFKGPWVEGKYFELTPSGNLSKKRTSSRRYIRFYGDY